MKVKLLLIVLLLIVSPRSEAMSPFLGKWTVTQFICIDKSSEWCQDQNRPVAIHITQQDDGYLLARYRTKKGIEVSCFYAVEAVEGHELLLVSCPPPYKSGTIYSPLHRVKLRNGRMEALGLTDKPVFKWSAGR
ncbi:hypothetical protein GCM10027430_28930 [Lysobacter tyrosinilyticus]